MNTRLRPNTLTFACSAYGPEPGAVTQMLAEMQQWIAAPACERIEESELDVRQCCQRPDLRFAHLAISMRTTKLSMPTGSSLKLDIPGCPDLATARSLPRCV